MKYGNQSLTEKKLRGGQMNAERCEARHSPALQKQWPNSGVSTALKLVPSGLTIC